jgi:hypothetical protein
MEEKISIFENLKRKWYKKFNILVPISEEFHSFHKDEANNLYVLVYKFKGVCFYWEKPQILELNIYSSDGYDWRDAEGYLFNSALTENRNEPVLIFRAWQRNEKETELRNAFQQKYKLSK